jgi:hypothetical protein
LHSPRGLEPLQLAAGTPCHIDGNDRNGSLRVAYVIAVPRALLQQNGERSLPTEFPSHNWGPGVLKSHMIDFHSDVPFYDSRDRVIDRYRLTLDSAASLRLVWVGQNQGSVWVKGAWAAVGLSLSVSIIWFGCRLIRRFSTRNGCSLRQQPPPLHPPRQSLRPRR